jgi:prepilin-type N-terminal cleavage/methylation domain-containing protein
MLTNSDGDVKGSRRLTKRDSQQESKAGFTLVELLVVISIVGVLFSIVLPAVQYAREAGRKVTCKNHLRQVALATKMYHDTMKRFPYGHFIVQGNVGPDSRAWSWLARILPYIEENNLYREGRIPAATLRQSTIVDRPIPLYLCASDEFSQRGPRSDAGNLGREALGGVPIAVGQTNYQGVSGANWGTDGSQPQLEDIGSDWRNAGRHNGGTDRDTPASYDGLDNGDGIMWRSDYLKPRAIRHVRDGQSKTFLAGECLPEKNRYVSWPYANNAYATCAIPPNVVPAPGRDYSPGWWPNVCGFRSAHAGGLYFAMIDTSVRWVEDGVELGVYRAQATIAGGD